MKNSTGVLLTMIGAAAGGMAVGKLKSRKEENPQDEKFRRYFHIMDHWLTVKESGKDTSAYFISNDFRTIAVYGLGVMGRHLCEELRGTEVKIACGIDRKRDQIVADMEVISPDDELPEADAIVVTATFDFEHIERALREKTVCPIISLEEVILGSM